METTKRRTFKKRQPLMIEVGQAQTVHAKLPFAQVPGKKNTNPAVIDSLSDQPGEITNIPKQVAKPRTRWSEHHDTDGSKAQKASAVVARLIVDLLVVDVQLHDACCQLNSVLPKGPNCVVAKPIPTFQ